MSTKAKHLQKSYRQGEGYPLTVSSRASGDPGKTTLEFSLHELPVPDRRYVADVASVIRANGFVRMLFGQTKIDGVQLRSLLDIHFPISAISRFLGTAKALEVAFDELKSSSEFSPVYLSDIKDEPEQTIGLTANILMASCSGEESCMDLYQISPYSVAEVKKGRGLSADPVVRVSLPTELLLSLIEEFHSIIGSIHINEEKT